MIDKFHPQIVFLDVNMPIMNGIEVLEFIKEKKYPCGVIVLSCHDEFAYVRDAMKLGAKDYILKQSMNSVDLVKTINNVMSSMDTVPMELWSEKQTDTIQYSYLRKDFLIKLIKGRIPESNSEIENLNFSKSNIFLVLFEIDDYTKIMLRYQNTGGEQLYNYLSELIANILLEYPNSDFFEYNDNQFVIVTSFDYMISEKNIEGAMNELLKTISGILENYLNIHVCFGVSHKTSSIKNLDKLFAEAYQSLSIKFYRPEKTIFYHSDIKQKDELSITKNINFEAMLKRYLLEKDYSELYSSYLMYIEFLYDYMIKPSSIKQFFADIVNQINDLNFGQSEKYVIQILQSTTLLEIQQIIEPIICTLIQARNTQTSDAEYTAKKIMK